jgi:hypothetical protein
MGDLATVHFWRSHFWTAALLIGASVLVVLAVAVRGHDSKAFDRHICQRVDNLDGVIVATLKRQQKGLPQNHYYRMHPADLHQAQHELRKEISDFTGATC